MKAIRRFTMRDPEALAEEANSNAADMERLLTIVRESLEEASDVPGVIERTQMLARYLEPDHHVAEALMLLRGVARQHAPLPFDSEWAELASD